MVVYLVYIGDHFSSRFVCARPRKSTRLAVSSAASGTAFTSRSTKAFVRAPIVRMGTWRCNLAVPNFLSH
jgi:hypothetical protein